MKTPKKWESRYLLFIDCEGKTRIMSGYGGWVDPKNDGNRIIRYFECNNSTVPKEIQEMAKAYKY